MVFSAIVNFVPLQSSMASHTSYIRLSWFLITSNIQSMHFVSYVRWLTAIKIFVLSRPSRSSMIFRNSYLSIFPLFSHRILLLLSVCDTSSENHLKGLLDSQYKSLVHNRDSISTIEYTAMFSLLLSPSIVS